MLSRSHPGSTDFWDGNWLRTPLSGTLGGFRFEVAQAQPRADEIARFAKALIALHESLIGEARLESLEDWVNLTITGDGSGRLDVAGTVRDDAGSGNALRFGLDGYDQSFLPPLIADLTDVLAVFPVLGRPTR